MISLLVLSNHNSAVCFALASLGTYMYIQAVPFSKISKYGFYVVKCLCVCE